MQTAILIFPWGFVCAHMGKHAHLHREGNYALEVTDTFLLQLEFELPLFKTLGLGNIQRMNNITLLRSCKSPDQTQHKSAQSAW